MMHRRRWTRNPRSGADARPHGRAAQVCSPGLRRTCAALAGGALLAATALTPAWSQAPQQPAEAQHPVHHGRRHRLDAAEHLPPRPDGRRDAQHRPHRQGRRDLHGLRRHAELHLRPQRLLHRHVSAAHRHDPAATARQPVLSAARHPGARQVPARPRLQHRRVRQEPPGRPHRCAADRARLPGVLGLSLPSRRHAGGELPRHQQDPDRAGRRAAVQEHADPRPARGPRRRGPEDDALPDAAAPGPRVQVVGRHGEEPDLQRRRAR